MKILISNYDYPGLVKGLENLGHTVLHEGYNWWPWCWGENKGTSKSPHEFHEFLTAECLQHKPDAVIIGKGFDSNQPLTSIKHNPGSTPTAKELGSWGKARFWHILPKTIEYLKASGIMTMWLSLDQPDDFGWSIATGVPQICDAIGTCCIEVKDMYKRFTASEVFEFWPAWDTELRSVSNPTKEHDFLIIGTPYFTPNSQFGIPRREIALAALEIGVKPTIYGPEYWIDDNAGGSSDLKPYYKGFANWDDLHNIFAKSKITYNSFLRRGFRYVNDRIFIAGPVSFLLMENQIGLEMEFVADKHVGWHQHKDIDDFKNKLKFWLENDNLRNNCLKAMQSNILNNHTYLKRAELIDSVLKKVSRKKESQKGCCRG